MEAHVVTPSVTVVVRLPSTLVVSQAHTETPGNWNRGEENPMFTELTRYWWAVALRGLAAVLFGVAAFVWPGATLAALVLLFGAYALVDGIFNVVYAFSSGTTSRGPLVLQGIVSIGLGVVALAWPGITTVALLYVIAAWAVVTGVLEIVAAIELRKVIENEWLMGLGGIASIAFGVILAVQPQAGALAMVWLIGAYAIVFGALLIVLGFKLRSMGQQGLPNAGSTRPSAGGAAVRP
jgi:uncharacterized membrane protein HdeD (DUF308 family)